MVVSEGRLEDGGASRQGAEDPRGEKPSTHGGGERPVKLSLAAGWFIRRLERLLSCRVRCREAAMWRWRLSFDNLGDLGTAIPVFHAAGQWSDETALWLDCGVKQWGPVSV